MNVIVFFIIAVASLAWGRLTRTIPTRELRLALKSEQNETKSFYVQAWIPGSNICIPNSLKNQFNYYAMDINYPVPMLHINTYQPDMHVELDFYDYIFYLGIIDCDPKGIKENNYVPIKNGGICNHETDQRFTGQIYFYSAPLCPN